jgi:hypothetical protein
LIYADAIKGGTNYRFEVSNSGTVRTIETTSHVFQLTSLSGGVQNGTSYAVRVAAKVNNMWTDYGASCTITTPLSLLSKIQSSQCGITLAAINTLIYADAKSETTRYRFEVSNGVNVRTIESTSRILLLTSLSGGAAYSTNYSIRVAVLFEGVWRAFGPACTVTTPAAPVIATRIELVEKKEMVQADFKASAYPNPFVDSFELQLDNLKEDEVSVSVFDLAGKQIETRVLSIGNKTNQFFGNQYQSGVYNVVISHGADVKHVRLIKR